MIVLSKRISCVEPKIGQQIKKYDDDAHLPSKAKKLKIEEKYMLETHLIRCSFCRKKLSESAHAELKIKLIFANCHLKSLKRNCQKFQMKNAKD